MTEKMIFVSHTAAAGVRAVLGLILISRLLAGKRPGGKSILTVLAGAAITTGAALAGGMPDRYRMGVETVWIVFCAVRFQGTAARMSLFLGIFFEIAVSFWQFLFAAWLGVLTRSAAFLAAGTGSGQIALWILHGPLAIFALWLRGYRGTGDGKAFRTVSAGAAAGIFLVVTLSEQTRLTLPEDTLEMWMIQAVILLMSVLVFRISRQYQMEKELAEIKTRQAELLEREYTTLNQAYGINARLFHDFHNHIGVLQQLLTHGKLQQALQYLDGLQAPVREMAQTCWTGDETIDYLINSKTLRARQDGTDLQVQVEFPRNTGIRSVDLCAILGNLLDNALEAAGNVPETERRWVRLTIRRINQMLVIKVENSLASPPVEKGGELKTTKEDNGLHGWGLKSARTAAEKYDGVVETSCTQSVFRAVATLSYQGMKEVYENI